MTKQKSALPFIGVPTTTPVTDALLETGNQDMVYCGWWAGIRRTVANFFTEKAKRLRASPEDVRKMPLTVTEQIDLVEQLQRMRAEKENRGYGRYPQEPVRVRYLPKHLMRRARDQVEDAELHEPDQSGDQSNDQST